MISKNNKRATLRFYLWLFIVIAFFCYFLKLLFTGITFDTNIMHLLPSSLQNPSVTQASNRFSKYMGQQVIFLVGNSHKTSAEKAADQLANQLEHAQLFEKIQYKISEEEQQAWGSFYFPYRLALLTPSQQTLLNSGDIKKIQQTALFDLYSPMGIVNAKLLAQDPYFLFQHFITSLPRPASKLTLFDNRMMVHQDKQWHIMLSSQLKGDSFSIATQNKVVSLIQNSIHQITRQYPGTTILSTGLIFYAKAGADSAQQDILTIGIGSLLGIILLILLTFRSLSPLLFILLSSTVGLIAAFVATSVLFGSVYLFTLVCGASLIGISVDYAFFYYAEQLFGGTDWHPSQGLNNIFTGITLGLLNIVLAYFVISFAPFPALKQLAVFAIVGLSMAYATVVCAFPRLLRAKTYTFKPVLLTLTNYYLKLWKNLSTKHLLLIYAIIMAIIIGGLLLVKPNDDIRILESPPAHLKNNEAQIKHIIGSHMGTAFYVVQGNTPEQVITHEAQLTHLLDKTFPFDQTNYLAISRYVPSIAGQKENFSQVKTKLLNPSLIQYLEKIGMPKQKATAIQQTLAAIKFKPLTIDAWQHSPVSHALRFLWLGKVDMQYASIVLLAANLNKQTLKNIATKLPAISYIDKADEVSQLFMHYREKISLLLALAYAVLFILLALRYSLKKAFLYFIPPASACLLGVAAMGWFAIPLTLFNVLALILVLGIGVDYVLFFAETKSNYQATMLAVSLSAITTMLSFGLLALSHTPAIHFFGVTVLIGITSAFMLSPLAILKYG